ncbi:MAG: GntR family transcriptional regulator [Motiliproteus sp.]
MINKPSNESSIELVARQRTVKRNSPLRRVIQPSLSEIAKQQLRYMIVRGTLAPGEKLVEPELCEAFGISRTPLRDAFKSLAAEGLIKLRRNRNSIVAPIDAQQLEHLFEVEAGIEGMAIALASQRMTNTDIKRLEALQERIERLQHGDDMDAYFELNQKIHSMIVEGAKNPVLQETHSHLLGRLERARYAALGQFGRIEESIQEHRMILDALKARDSVRVQQLMQDHVRHTGDLVTAICNNFRRSSISR